MSISVSPGLIFVKLYIICVSLANLINSTLYKHLCLSMSLILLDFIVDMFLLQQWSFAAAYMNII